MHGAFNCFGINHFTQLKSTMCAGGSDSGLIKSCGKLKINE